MTLNVLIIFGTLNLLQLAQLDMKVGKNLNIHSTIEH